MMCVDSTIVSGFTMAIVSVHGDIMFCWSNNGVYTLQKEQTGHHLIRTMVHSIKCTIVLIKCLIFGQTPR